MFEPVYPPRKVEFWLEHWEELETLAYSPKASAHIAEHLNREWFLLQVRMKVCMCAEMADDPYCQVSPGGGDYRAGAETIRCVVADLAQAADKLPSNWFATHKIWQQMAMPMREIERRSRQYETREREPLFARHIALRRMARALGWIPATEQAA